jgi:hypothetical protein
LFWNNIKTFVLDKKKQTQCWGDSQSGVQTLLTTTLGELSEKNAIKVFQFGWPDEEEDWEHSESGASLAPSQSTAPSVDDNDGTSDASSAESTELSESDKFDPSTEPREGRSGPIL